MQYEWEAKLTEDAIDSIASVLSQCGLQLAGIAACEPDNGEAALVFVDTGESDIFEADIRKDIMGDAEGQYEQALEDIRAKFTAMRTN